MGWSYDPTHLDVPLNQVRFLIGDTVQDDPLIEEDDEINFCLAQKGNNIYLAGAFACRRASTRLVREVGLVAKTGLELDVTTEVENLTKKAIELETEAIKQGGAGLYLGGISKADIDNRESNTDRVVPGITVNKHMPSIQLNNDLDPEELWHW